MDSRQIEVLLKKYWACETSCEEERTLKAFFEGNDIPPELKDYAPFFLVLKEKARIQAPDSMDVYSSANIQKAQMPPKRPLLIGYLHAGLKVAAVALILISVGLGIQTRYQNEEILIQTYSESLNDPEEALKEVYQAFNKIGLSLAKGQSALTELKDSTQINQK